MVIACQMQDFNLSENMLTYYWFYVPASILKLVRYSTNNRLSDKSKIFFCCAYMDNVAQSSIKGLLLPWEKQYHVAIG